MAYPLNNLRPKITFTSIIDHVCFTTCTLPKHCRLFVFLIILNRQIEATHRLFFMYIRFYEFYQYIPALLCAGISTQTYDAAVSDGRELLFTCTPCQQTMAAVDGVESMSDVDGVESMSDVDAVPNVTAFDLPETDRSFLGQPVEPSLLDATVDSVPPPTAVTFEVIPNGTERGRPKLVSSDGFSYVINRQLKKSTDWRCSVRTKANKCPATVKQVGDAFETSSVPHSHSARPGLHWAVQKKVEVIIIILSPCEINIVP